jgi:DNA-binding response OmpR family regulator
MVANGPEATVLVVEDEQEVADSYESELEPRYETLVANDGNEALELVDKTIDVILLDRGLPGLTGDEVLEAIHEGGLDCQIVIVSAVDPDFDIIEMPFDEYITKPVRKQELLDAVERQLDVADSDESVAEFLEIQSKLDVLEEEKPATELENTEEIHEMRERASELEAALWETIDEFET